MSSDALSRLLLERKEWRKNHPFGFVAKPKKKRDGTLNLMKWTCSIPGKNDSPWMGGVYQMQLTFCEDYPASPPFCKFTPPIFHPNISETGTICLSILDESKDWRPDFSIKFLLMELQKVMHTPNKDSPLNTVAYTMWRKDKLNYIRQIKQQAAQMAPTD